MITTQVYPEKKVLALGLKERVTKMEFTELHESLPSIFRTLPRDFILLCDCSEMEAMDFACSGDLASLMDRLVKAGVSKVVRVIPNPKKDIGFNILSIFHYPPSLPIHVLSDLAEAQSQLGINPIEDCTLEAPIDPRVETDYETTSREIP